MELERASPKHVDWSRTLRIFGIGTVVVDNVVELASFPEIDSKQLIQRYWQQVGGPVPVALSTAAFYGSSCSFLGRWADDSNGHTIQSVLNDRGIYTCPFTPKADWKTGFAQVWNETATGTRTIAYSRGDFTDITEVDLPMELLAEHDVLHLDGNSPDASIPAARLMHERGGIVVLDAGSVKPRMDELLPYVDVLIASALFRRSRFGNTAVPMAELLGLGCRSVITTNGPGDIIYADEQTEVVQAAYPVDAVDTTGAGDTFAGAILHGLASRWPMKRTLDFAAKVAAWSCARRGNSSWPTLAELDESTPP